MSDFKIKLHQIRFRLGLRDPAGGAYSAPPDPLAGFNGPTSRGWGGGGKGMGKEGEGWGLIRASIDQFPQLFCGSTPMVVDALTKDCALQDKRRIYETNSTRPNMLNMQFHATV